MTHRVSELNVRQCGAAASFLNVRSAFVPLSCLYASLSLSRVIQPLMPRIAVKGADQLRREHPREFSLLFELGGSADGIDTQVLLVGAVASQNR